MRVRQELGIRESPLGMHGVRMLLKPMTSGKTYVDVTMPVIAVLAVGNDRHVDIRGCSFRRNYAGQSITELNERNPNGKYSLDLSNSVDRLIAKRLLELAKEHGAQSWRTSLLNDYPFHLSSKVPVTSMMLHFISSVR